MLIKTIPEAFDPMTYETAQALKNKGYPTPHRIEVGSIWYREGNRMCFDTFEMANENNKLFPDVKKSYNWVYVPTVIEMWSHLTPNRCGYFITFWADDYRDGDFSGLYAKIGNSAPFRHHNPNELFAKVWIKVFGKKHS